MGSVSGSTWIFAVLIGSLTTMGIYLVERGHISQEVEETLNYQASAIFPSTLGYGHTSRSVIADINTSINSGTRLAISSAKVSLSEAKDELSPEAIPPAIPHTVTSYFLSLRTGLLLIASIAASLGLILILEKVAKAFRLGEAHDSKHVPQFVQEELRKALNNSGIEYDSEPIKIRRAVQKLTEQQHRDLTNAIMAGPGKAKIILDLIQAKPGVKLILNKEKSELHVHGLVMKTKVNSVGFALYAWLLSRKASSGPGDASGAHLVPPCAGDFRGKELANEFQQFLDSNRLPIHGSLVNKFDSPDGINRKYMASNSNKLKQMITEQLFDLDWIAESYLVKQSEYKKPNSQKGYEVTLDKACIEIVTVQSDEQIQL